MSDWFYAINQTKIPVTETELIELIRSGQLHGGILVWSEGMADWQQISQSQFAEILEETEVCAISGNIMQRTELLQYGNFWIAPDQTEQLVQSMMQLGYAPIRFRLATLTSAAFNLYKSPNLLGQIAKWTIVIGSGLTLLNSVGILLSSITSGLGFFPLIAFSNMMVFFLAITSVITYCIWKGRCVTNCKAADDAPNRSDMMVSGYFIPIVNLWTPFLCMKELWRATMEEGDNEKKIALVDFWWAVWMAGYLFAVLSMFTPGKSYLFALFSILNMIAAVLIFRIIEIISKKQVKRFGNSF